MDREKIMRWIERLERKYPVDEWKVDDFHIWPILRVYCFFYLSAETSSNAPPPPAPATLVDKVTWLLTAFRFLISLRSTDFTFVGAFAHRVIYRNSWYNRFFDPVIEALTTAGFSSTRLEYDDPPANLPVPLYRQDSIGFLKKIVYPFQLLEKLSRAVKSNRSEHLPQYQEFLRELESNPQTHSLSRQLSPGHLSRITEGISYYRRFFRYYLRVAHPTLLIGLCYYSYPLYGALAAAHERGIPSVDLQHGPQSGIHAAYARFNKVPPGGYNTLPRLFWVWDQESENSLREWVNQQTFHTVKQWGHPWVRYWLERGVRSTTDHTKPLILYSLQPVGELLEPLVVKAIQQSHRQYQWQLRLHPRQQYAKNDLLAILQRASLDREVVIDDGLHQPLPKVLAKTRVHLTRFSGTAQEAAMLGVPTVFLDVLATQCFPELIASGEATYVPFANERQLLDTIKKACQQPKKRPNEQSMVPYDELFQSTL